MLRNHPHKTLILAGVGFVLWSLPQWIGTVWPLFTTKTIPEWMAERSWPGLTAPVYAWLTVALIAAAAIVVYMVPRTNGAQSEETPVNGKPSVTASEWLMQEARFKGLSGHSCGIWLRNEGSSEVTWNVTPMAGSSMDDLRCV